MEDISNDNGQTVKNLLQKLVDDSYKWKWTNQKNRGEKHAFAVGGKPVIIIESTPIQDEPGNGFVSFYNNITKKWVAPKWDNLEITLKDPSFPSYYEKFNSQPMNEVAQDNVGEDKKFQTAFLLLFEIARRVEKSESPTRKETEDAIGIVLSHSVADHLLDMFTKEERRPHSDYLVADFHGRKQAFARLLMLKDTFHDRQLEGYDLWLNLARLPM